MAIANATVDLPAPGGPAIMLTSPRRILIWLSDQDLNGRGMTVLPWSMWRIALSSCLMLGWESYSTQVCHG